MSKKNAILRTLTYSDIFDCPLTLSQIYKFYNDKSKLSKDEIKQVIVTMPQVYEEDGLYFLEGKNELLIKKKFREEESSRKIVKAKRIARLLKIIPTIKLVSLSGSLAQRNANPTDDIDFFIVTKESTVWISRLFINLTLLLIGQKRKRNVKTARDKICPNMIVGENALTIPPQARSLYTARELVQTEPLINKGFTQEKLILSNLWIKEYLPNTYFPQIKLQTNKKPSILIDKIDTLLFHLQKRYMGKVTNEVVKKDIAKFHPRNTREYILNLFSTKEKLLVENNSIRPQIQRNSRVHLTN